MSQASMCPGQTAPLGVAPACPHCDAPLPACTTPRARCPACARTLTVCGGFAVAEEIGRGGVARILAGLHADGREAAVKVLDRTAFNPWQVHQFFARSARLGAAFRHPGLPRVLGFEKSTSGRSFLAMERLRGGTLSDRVAGGERVEGAAFESLLRNLLEALAYLHDRSYLHGDVTPRNVMFRDAEGREPVLIDLDGLCSVHERGVPTLVMTPGYSAPEQRAGEVTAAADLYGVGATMIYAATGRSPDELPRRGPRLSLEVTLPGVSPRTRDLVERLLELDPKRRPRSARAAIVALDAPVTWLRRAAMVAAAAVVLFLAASLAVRGLQAKPLPPAGPASELQNAR